MNFHIISLLKLLAFRKIFSLKNSNYIFLWVFVCLLLVACAAVVWEDHFQTSVECSVMCEMIGVLMWQTSVTEDFFCFSLDLQVNLFSIQLSHFIGSQN